jgi:hypothetical protein
LNGALTIKRLFLNLSGQTSSYFIGMSSSNDRCVVESCDILVPYFEGSMFMFAKGGELIVKDCRIEGDNIQFFIKGVSNYPLRIEISSCRFKKVMSSFGASSLIFGFVFVTNYYL